MHSEKEESYLKEEIHNKSEENSGYQVDNYDKKHYDIGTFLSSEAPAAPPKPKLLPMSPLAASATVINLILATGPFSYPLQFANLGPVFSLILLIFTCFISFITSTYIVEVISYSNALKSKERLGTLFPDQVYSTPDLRHKFNKKDVGVKTSPYYIREKVELGKLAEQFCQPWLKVMMMIILVIYMYGAMCTKYASGAESFVQAVSFTIYDNANQWTKEWEGVFDPYYIGIIIFGSLSLLFSFGNIENSKMLQIVTGFMRLLVITFMYGGSIYYLGSNGVHAAPVFNVGEQFTHIANTFGGTVFVFIFHHSISGIVYPIRPQSDVRPMFLTSHIIGSSMLAIEGLLAYLAFSGLPNDCTSGIYPCKISSLFNENFVNIPVIGQICNFYPMLNVSSVPVLTITLRNNLMEVLPIKQWLRKSDSRAAKYLLQDHLKVVKGIWSIVISIPVIVIVLFVKNPQKFITYTGGICGTFILFMIPMSLVYHVRKRDIEKTYGPNFNKSPFKHGGFMVLVLSYAVITLAAVITGLIIA